MLDEIRTLSHAMHSPVPTFPVTAAGITASSKVELCEKVKEKCPTSCPYKLSPPQQDLDQMNPWLRKTLEHIPYPETTWEHAKSCMYGDEPDVVFKSRDDVETMDRYARERLANINALLDAGVDCELGPDRDAELAAKLEQAQGYHSCIVNSKGDLPSPSPFDENPVVTESLLTNMAESEARTLLRAEKTRLEESLATSSLAKGMYFKRCNKAWVSAIGEILPFGKLWEQLKSERCTERPNSQIPDPSYTRVDWDFVRGGRMRFPEQKQDLGTRSTITTTSSAVSGSTTYSVSVTNSRATTPPSCMEDTNGVSSATSITSQIAAPNGRKSLVWHDMNVTKIIRAEPSFGYALPDPVPSPNVWNRDKITRAIERPTCGQEGCFSYKTSMLVAREAMVRSGQVKPEDLIVTSWGHNREMKRVLEKENTKFSESCS